MAEDVQHDKELVPDELMERWQGRIELAQRYQDQHGNTSGRWSTNVKAMGGDFNSVAELGAEAIDVNMVHSTVKAVLPPLWLSDPFVTVKATTSKWKGVDNVHNAEKTEIEINYWIRELNVRDQVKQVVTDGEATNLGYLYLGYHSSSNDVSDEHDPVHKKGQPFVLRVSPKDVLVPPGYTDLEKMPWVGIRFRKPLLDLMEKYDKKRMEDVPTDSYSESGNADKDTEGFSSYLKSDDAMVVTVIDIWDKRTKKVLKLVPSHDQFLEEPESWPVKVEGFPLLSYQPESIPDEYFGTPPISYYLPQNKELNSTRTAMKKLRSRTKAVIFVDSSIEDEVKEAYAAAKDGDVIGVPIGEGDEGDIRRRILIDPGLPFDNGDLAYDAIMKDDIREQSGYGAERRGGGDPNVGSATASANIEKGVQIREADRGDGVKKLYLGVAKKLWMILKQHPNLKRTRLIAGANAAAMQNVTYTLKELEGDYNFDMDFGAMMADNPVTRASRAGLNYNLMRGDPLVEPNRLVLDLLKSQNVPDPEAYLMKLRSPQEELQIMQSGIPVEANERDNHEEHLQLHEAQAGKIDKALRQMDPASEERGRTADMQGLLLAHITHHEQIFEKMGGNIEGTGKPIAENMLRNQIRRETGGETQAEITGGPLSPEQLVK